MTCLPVTIVASRGASARLTASVLAFQISGCFAPAQRFDGRVVSADAEQLRRLFQRSAPSLTPICAKYWLHETSYAVSIPIRP